MDVQFASEKSEILQFDIQSYYLELSVKLFYK